MRDDTQRQYFYYKVRINRETSDLCQDVEQTIQRTGVKKIENMKSEK